MVKTFKELQVSNLLALAKDHKEHCNRPDCGVFLSLVRPVYQELINRDLTQEENDCFL